MSFLDILTKLLQNPDVTKTAGKIITSDTTKKIITSDVAKKIVTVGVPILVGGIIGGLAGIGTVAAVSYVVEKIRVAHLNRQKAQEEAVNFAQEQLKEGVKKAKAEGRARDLDIGLSGLRPGAVRMNNATYVGMFHNNNPIALKEVVYDSIDAELNRILDSNKNKVLFLEYSGSSIDIGSKGITKEAAITIAIKESIAKGYYHTKYIGPED